MENEPLRVLVTGAAGRIGYVLCSMIASGQVFGKQPIILHLFDLPEKAGLMVGLQMELHDCAYDNLKNVIVTCDPVVAFEDIAFAILCGGLPRASNAPRHSLLVKNVHLFRDHGRSLNASARQDCKVLVLTNPCHTLALICSDSAPRIPKENFTSLSRLDHNRGISQIALKLNVSPATVKNVIVWGNHSETMFPDGTHAVVNIHGKNKRVMDVLDDETFLRHKFVDIIQNRASEIIAARKSSAVISAAKAAVDHIHDWCKGTAPGTVVTMGVYSDGSYGAPKDIFFSFPVEVYKGQWTIVKGYKLDDYTRNKIDISGKELLKEKEMAYEELGEDIVEISPSFLKDLKD